MIEITKEDEELYQRHIINKIKLLKEHIKAGEEYFKGFKGTNMDTRAEKAELEENKKLLFLYEYQLKNGKKFINGVDGFL